ncbi:MAG: hypothetical protein JXB85_07145 [Anaerolineales bacterium]|nr:hypothetical protein [Anaerolineales bacterium]
MNTITTGLLVFVTGGVAVLGAVFNWRLIVGEGKLLTRLLGVTATRVLTAVAGFLLIGLGIGLILGWV